MPPFLPSFLPSSIVRIAVEQKGNGARQRRDFTLELPLPCFGLQCDVLLLSRAWLELWKGKKGLERDTPRTEEEEEEEEEEEGVKT